MRVLLQFARKYMLPYTGWYIIGTLALLATNWMAVTIPLYVADAIDALRDNRSDVVFHAAVTVGGMGVAMMFVRTLSRVFFFTPGRYAEAKIKQDLFARVLEQQPGFIAQFPPGDLVSRASSDINHLRLLSGFGALQIINVTMILVLTLTQMVRLSPSLTLWTTIPLAIGLFITRFFIRWLFVLIKKIQRQMADLSDYILTSYQGISTIHGFNAEGAFLNRFVAQNEALQTTLLRRTALRTVISPILTFSTGVCVFLILYIGGAMSVQGELSTGEVVAFIALVSLLAGPLRGLSFLLAIVKQAQASLERLEQVAAPEPDRPDLGVSLPAPEQSPAISVQGLTFSYPGQEIPVLKDVSFSIGSGQTLGVFGPTGSGKSTILRCLSRLHNPPEGTIHVDGQELRHIHLDRWRDAMILVPQRPFLFSESIWDNIAMGEFERDAAPDILSMTALEQDVSSFPEGLDTQVGESGVMLSGGQRQRIALARGLIRSPRVLMLDDVLSAVDHRTEHQLIQTLQSSGATPTTVIVAHRISAIRHAEHIIVMEHGRISDQGTHDELVSRAGLYQDTWAKQQEVQNNEVS